MKAFNMKALSIPGFVVTAALVSGCAGVPTSNMRYNNQLQVNAPQKSPDCYDAAVLMNTGIERTKDITKKVLVALDATIESEQPDSLKAQRNRHVGVFVGSGGEELFVRWNAVDAAKTYVTVATKTGFVGGAGQKAWSCQMVDEMVKMAI
jgi:hypothetical protein